VALKIQISDETTDVPTSHLTKPAQHAGQVIGYSHSIRPPNNGSQVAGYKRDKARGKNRSAAYVSICKQDFLSATQYDNDTLSFRGHL